MSDQRQAELGTAREHTAAQRAILQRAERDLHGRDGCQLECFVELTAGDVREADAVHQSALNEAGEGAHRGPPGRPRVRRVDEEQVDRQPVERRETRFAMSRDDLRTAIGHPPATGSRHSALGDDPGAALPTAHTQRVGQQALAVPERRPVGPVRVRGIEHGYAGVAGGENRVERELLIGLEAHAAEADAELECGQARTPGPLNRSARARKPPARSAS